MKSYQLFLLTGAVYLAPHISKNFALGMAVGLFLAAVIFWRVEK